MLTLQNIIANVREEEEGLGNSGNSSDGFGNRQANHGMHRLLK